GRRERIPVGLDLVPLAPLALLALAAFGRPVERPLLARLGREGDGRRLGVRGCRQERQPDEARQRAPGHGQERHRGPSWRYEAVASRAEPRLSYRRFISRRSTGLTQGPPAVLGPAPVVRVEGVLQARRRKSKGAR